MKKFFKLFLLMAMITALVASCQKDDTNAPEDNKTTETTESKTEEKKEDKKEDKKEEKKDEKKDETSSLGTINVISREDGSGTRGAFTELVGLIDENKNDMTWQEAVIQNGTDAVVATVSGGDTAIGYISLGSVNDTIKPLKVDGVEASVEDINNGSYKISRPFNSMWKEGEISEAAQALVDFIMSSDAQPIVEKSGFISILDSAKAYEAKEGLSGKVTVGGSTSVTPLMEKIVEKFNEVQKDIEVSINPTGSTAGVTGAIDGTLDIGMASRELKAEEAEKIHGEAMAKDGIAVIVNKNNSIDDISMESIKNIFLGELRDWKDVK